MSYSINGYLSASAAPITTMGAMTMHCWMKTTEGNNRNFLSIHNEAGGDNRMLQKRGQDLDKLRAEEWEIGVALNNSDVGTIADSTWTSVGGTFGAPGSNSVIAYVDGTAGTEATASTPSNFDTFDEFFIGASRGGSTISVTNLAEVAMWDIVLTPTQMTSLSNGANPLAIAPSNLVFYAPLEDDLTNLGTGSETLSWVGTAGTQDADHPTIDAAPSGSSAATRLIGSSLVR